MNFFNECLQEFHLKIIHDFFVIPAYAKVHTEIPSGISSDIPPCISTEISPRSLSKKVFSLGFFKKFRNFKEIYFEISHQFFLGIFTKVQVLLQKFLRASFKNTITKSSRNSFRKTSMHFIGDFFRNNIQMLRQWFTSVPYLFFFDFLYFSFILIRFGYKISLFFFHISWSFFFQYIEVWVFRRTEKINSKHSQYWIYYNRNSMLKSAQT